MAAGHHPHTAPDDTLTLASEHAVAFPDEIATVLVRAGTAPLHLTVAEEDLESLLRLVGQGATA
ncbi:hypothetical protein Rhe02_32990 [Rhizocola hellebori]|uniref:Uncharacterized protein n=1 Tax=Rhizocola hellebori TaxID=1392758 RepID=A0A8J3VGK2_9ACTN|nr:hypothetical protein [Rhizocola hellebori]GIH05232.1 hypothetical protein Rhe02_32990 [Rhizocola hellebori]